MSTLSGDPQFLIVKTSALGDIIHCFPVVDYLKEQFPSCQIDWVVEEGFAELLRAHPAIRRVLPIRSKLWRKRPWTYWEEIRSFRRDLRSKRYDVLFDLQGNMKSGLVTLQARAFDKVGFGRKSVPEWPNLLVTTDRYNVPTGMNIREDYLQLVQQHMGDKGSLKLALQPLRISEDEAKRIVALFAIPKIQKRNSTALICPGSAWPNKRLPESSLKRLMELWVEKEDVAFLLAWGSQEERALAERLYDAFPSHSLVIDKMSLPALQHIMGRVDTVLAMDSLPLHLCGTTPTPSFSVFGPSSAAKYKPLGSQHFALQGACPYGKRFEKRCSALRTCPDAPCMQQWDPRELFDAFHSQREQ